MDVQTMGELFVNDENSQPASLLGATFLDSTCQAEDAIAVEVGVSIDPNKPTDGDHKNANSESSVTMGSGSHPCQDAGVVISGSASGSKNLSEQVSGQKEERRNPDQFMNGHSKPELAFQKRERVVAVEKSNGKITPEPIDERLGLGRNSGSSERVDQSIHLESSKQILHMEDSESPVFKNVHEFKEFIRTNYKAPTSKSPVLNGQVMKLVLDGNQKKLSTITDKLFPLLNYKSSRNICFPIRCLLKRIRAYYALPRYSEALWKLMESPFPSGGRGVARKSRDSLVDTSSLSTESSENGFQIAGKRLRSRSKEEPQKVQEQPSLPLNKNKARTRKQLDESPQPPNPDEEKSSHAQKPDT